MNSKSTAAILATFLFTTTVLAGPLQILLPGEWHGHEITASGGEDWWGIFPADDAYILKPAPVTISPCFDAVLDREGDESGKRVQIPQDAPPVLLIRGLESPAAGPLKTATRAPADWRATQSLAPEFDSFLFPGQSLQLRMGDELIRLVAYAAVEENPTYHHPEITGYEIRIQQGEDEETVSQRLARIARMRDLGRPHLDWAGDIDRDGKIDLLYNFTDHYNVTRRMLFLSSAAKAGELVGLVAEWTTMGC